MKNLVLLTSFYVIMIVLSACGGPQQAGPPLEIRPLEESKAFEIIEEILAERHYTHQKGVDVQLRNGVAFKTDYRVRDHKIAIEYLSEQDVQSMGKIPPAAEGSRLHVLSASVTTAPTSKSPEQVFVFFIHAKDFLYHFNPTPDRRADVTVLEVDSRLRRDLQDFLSWYETSFDQR